ncbi:MAG: hypothetical protein M3N46_11320 [Actinomycetota bacterium]|nr:hypothetical protein [Actinomycetota bacterium]
MARTDPAVSRGSDTPTGARSPPGAAAPAASAAAKDPPSRNPATTTGTLNSAVSISASSGVGAAVPVRISWSMPPVEAAESLIADNKAGRAMARSKAAAA